MYLIKSRHLDLISHNLNQFWSIFQGMSYNYFLLLSLFVEQTEKNIICKMSFLYIIVLNLAIILVSIIIIIIIVMNIGNRTEWIPIQSVIIQVINKIGRPRSGSPIC